MNNQNSPKNEFSKKKTALTSNQTLDKKLSSSSKTKTNLIRLSITPKNHQKKKNSISTKKKSWNSQNDSSFFKNIIKSSANSKRKSRYSFNTRPHISNIDRPSSSKKNSCLLFQKNTKKLYRKYSLGNESNTNNSNQNQLINANNSYLNIRNHLKRTIISMKKQIQSQKKIIVKE
jgi:hypothetical protein